MLKKSSINQISRYLFKIAITFKKIKMIYEEKLKLSKY